MPSIKRKICTRHGIFEGSRCPQCKKKIENNYDKTSRHKERNKFYHSSRWKKVRDRQLSLNPLCINFEECGNVAEIADHIIEIKDKGDFFSLDNLQSMCKSCHNTKTAQERNNREIKT